MVEVEVEVDTEDVEETREVEVEVLEQEEGEVLHVLDLEANIDEVLQDLQYALVVQEDQKLQKFHLRENDQKLLVVTTVKVIPDLDPGPDPDLIVAPDFKLKFCKEDVRSRCLKSNVNLFF